MGDEPRVPERSLRRRGAAGGGRGEVLRWQEAARGGRMLKSIGQSLHDLETREREFRREVVASPSLFRELVDTPPPRRPLLVANCPRFWIWALAEKVLHESAAHLRSAPALACELAETAVLLADHLDVKHYGPGLVEDMCARAWSAVGNAQRVLGHLDRAEQAFDCAEGHLSNGSSDPLEEGSFLDLKASLRRAQNRLPEAANLLARAEASFRRVQEVHLQGRAEAKQGLLWASQGRRDAAIDRLEAGLRRLDEERDARFAVRCRAVLCELLLAANRPFEARASLREAMRLAPGVPAGEPLPPLDRIAERVRRALLRGPSSSFEGVPPPLPGRPLLP